ncbi:AIPR family protein [Intrasporangium calvum]|uniref:AIPR family protein n=1 Tax=Intrasporangium calvum TaxID=53358 RepID=A0ABT5GF58_9MICO|nr:AIPR family protein [Intrasporangium calvum]MDC5696316.1 AIPR family protein [Intrasporangium calvum]
MNDSLAEFNERLQQAVILAASEEGNEATLPSRFVEYMLDVLTEAGETDDARAASYAARGARASGFELSEDEGTLHMFLADYRSANGVESLGKGDLDAQFKRLLRFVEQAKDGLWRTLEETSTGWDMAQRIHEAWKNVGELRLTLLTNAELKTNVPEPTDFEGRGVRYDVWDLGRLRKLDSSGRAQEPITVNVVELWGEPIPCLGPHGQKDSYEAYLLTLPGEFLASVYELYGPRLLELNVRSFLQSRGKVNRGIQETIRNEPARFLAYNNGISMTASAVELVDAPGGGRAIAGIHDLQIVNGGQTTASLHYAKVKTKADLSEVHVESKLSVVEPDRLSELVPLISQFANSQNRVNMADFTANDPFHVELEKLSRIVWAPGSGGGPHMTRWYYERARGQYADAHARERTPARQREFKKVHPLSQKFTKTDVAKFENTWDQLPWLVSLGAEKNFREFMLRLEKRGRFTLTPEYFQTLVAKAILFRSAERTIGSLQLGGYRAQAVTYTLAKLLNVTAQRVDLDAIWRAQEISSPLVHAIEELASLVHAKLVASAGARNISEWAKKEDCWKAVQAIEWQPSRELVATLLQAGRRTATTTDSSVGEILSDAEKIAMLTVSAVAAQTWFELSQWAKQTNNLMPWQRSLAFSLGKNAAAGKSNSRKQAVQGEKILGEAKRLGFAPSEVSAPPDN